jgi:PAS domain S-box-containing protein
MPSPAVMRWEAALQEVFATGQEQTIEFEQETPQGRRTFETRFAPELAEDGTVETVLTLSRDVTDRVQAEANVRALEDLYRRAIAAAGAVPYRRDYTGGPDGDPDHDTYSFMGEGILALCGYTAQEITPALWNTLTQEDVFHGPLDGLPLKEARRRARRGEVAVWTADTRIRTRTGEERWVADTAIELFDPHGRAVGSIGLLQDITARKQIEAQGRLAAVGQLAAGVAHDFNNILSAIVLYTDLLRRAPNLLPKQKVQLETVARQAEHASQLVQQILDFGRKTLIERSAVDLAALLEELVQLWQRTLPETIALRLSLGAGPYQVWADPNRLQQAVMNLVVNARDAMPEGGRLRLHLFHLQWPANSEVLAVCPPVTLRPGAWVVLHLRDSGTGIEPATLPHIFEPFFTTKGPGKGSGLGLAQVYGIVEQHGGVIEVESQVGRGTTFTLYLPAYRPAAAAAESAGEERSATGATVPPEERERQATILLVEDKASVRAAVGAALEELVYRVLVAEDGQAALAALEQTGEAVDLVVSDVVMPRLGGLALYQTLRVKRPNLRMILTSGYPLGEAEQAQIAQTQVVWLAKPYPIQALALKIRTLLDTSRPPSGGEFSGR